MLARPLMIAAVLSFYSLEASASSAPSYQQEAKLVGTDALGIEVHQGISVALSADGNTALVGGFADNSFTGAAWVYTRSGGVWSQQGSKLVGTGATASSYQGWSVALSADGNTAVVGGYGDNSGAGAAWVYTRSGGVWSQQGSKLVGTGAVGKANQGISAALSADGNTAVVGGYTDNNFAGAAWVYTRSGGLWSQQGAKLVGTGAVGNETEQGISVALSADGNAAAVSGPGDNGNAGAAWVYTRSGAVWSQQGAKLVGTGAVGSGAQGTSVALSADGNTAAVGGPGDNGNAGAAWVYTLSGGVWSQQGSKLVGTGAVGSGAQGASVALSADGNTAVVGGAYDNTGVGAAWVWTRSGGLWSQQGSKLVGTGAVGRAYQGHFVALSADGNTAIVGGPEDNRVGGGPDDPYADYAAGAAWVFFNQGGVVATLLSLLSADATADRVTLTWSTSVAATLSATVERRTSTTDWQTLGAPQVQGTEVLRYEDHTVTPGTGYDYRLAYQMGGPEQYTAETWVDVPRRTAVLSLDGARPNPSTGAMNVLLSLPNGSPATLTVLDIAGRVVMAREVGSLGAGQHVVPLPLGSTIAPGVYWLRLAQASRALYARTVVVR